MRHTLAVMLFLIPGIALAGEPSNTPKLIVKPDAFNTLVNPNCSHCIDEAKRRSAELRPDDRLLAWIRGYSDGGAIPFRFFLNPYRVISDSYGVFVHDPDAGFARGFAPSYEFTFHGWRNGVMVMKHQDGTLVSCLSGLAFAGPKKGTRLAPVPTLVSDWGDWLKRYPNAVAYHMFDKYQPVELPAEPNADAVRSRGRPDSRLGAEQAVLGVWTGKTARAYPLARLAKQGFVAEELDGEPAVIFWEPATKTAAAYRPVAQQPRKFQAPHPDKTGVSPPNPGTPLPVGAPALPPRKLTLQRATDSKPARAGEPPTARFIDQETGSRWDIAGRAVAGELQGWTLTWLDSTQVKWFAWAAEYPDTSIAQVDASPKPRR